MASRGHNMVAPVMDMAVHEVDLVPQTLHMRPHDVEIFHMGMVMTTRWLAQK